MRNRLIFTLLFLLVSVSYLNAQRQNARYDVNNALPWVSGRLPQNFNKVRYKVTYGEGTTYQQAREEATTSLILELGWEHGITVKSKTIDEIKHTINNNNSDFSQKRSVTTVIEQDNYTASITKVDEYSEIDKKSSQTTKYKVWQLYVIDCPWANQINLKYSTKYGFNIVGWRSLIIPGWGQFYKKQYIRGSLFLGTEIISIASTMYFQNKYDYNLKQKSQTNILDLQKEYSNRAHKHKMYRNISIGACVAVWVWNVLDATLTDGRPRYIESNFDFTLNSTNNNELFLSLIYKF